MSQQSLAPPLHISTATSLLALPGSFCDSAAASGTIIKEARPQGHLLLWPESHSNEVAGGAQRGTGGWILDPLAQLLKSSGTWGLLRRAEALESGTAPKRPDHTWHRPDTFLLEVMFGLSHFPCFHRLLKAQSGARRACRYWHPPCRKL